MLAETKFDQRISGRRIVSEALRAAAVFFWLALLSPVNAQTQACETEQGTIQTYLHDFVYGSWSSNQGSNYAVTYCVQNNGAKPLLVDWEGTDLKGFVQPGSVSTNATTDLPAPQFVSIDRDLRYGARPLKKSVRTVEFDNSVIVNPSEKQVVTTVTNISLPFTILRFYYGSPWSFPDGIEDRPTSLRNVTLTFVTTIDPETGQVEQRCHYVVDELPGDNGYSGVSYQIQFSDRALNEAMFGTDGPITVSRGEPQGIVQSQSRTFEFSETEFEFAVTQNTPDGEIVVKGASLVFYLGDTAIGSIPVNYFGGE